MRENISKIIAAILTVISVFAVAGVIAGCAPQAQSSQEAPADTAKTEQDMTVPAKFTMDNNCSACHTDATEAMTEAGFTGALHTDLSCITCHNNEEEMTSVHAENFNAKNANRVVTLVKSSVNEETCYACHDAMDELAHKTSASTLLTDEQGTVVNPHDLPENHFGVSVSCGSCHKMHNNKDAETASKNTCLNCHHDNVYECGTCHPV